MKSLILNVYVYIVGIQVGLVDVLQYAAYSKTTILDNSCELSQTISTITQVPRIWECAQYCNADGDCRLYLYCSHTHTCKLFIDGSVCVKSGDSSDCSCFKKDIGCINGNCTCPLGYYGEKCENIIKDCSDGVLNRGMDYTQILVTTIKPPLSLKSFDVMCFLGYGGWTTILQRDQSCSFENFNRSWTEYEEGFGVHLRNKWLGLEKLMKVIAIPSSQINIHVNLYSFESKCKSLYKDVNFGNGIDYEFSSRFDNEDPHCGDSLANASGQPFSTYDNDHTTHNCASRFGGGWWFADDLNCTRSFLTGTMDGSGTDNFWLDNLQGHNLVKSIIRIQRRE
ncbi:fibrinogen C domain-containing protein 1-like [Patella vulgata]|uniref:fibrinogen C domain-containing protein 1-like n=1 Tax=Patella vulgata TaxID=6465 RepID=UPI00217FC935|nr:fibrinogen C domain-containing protein 1-like [Patella vulgata]